MKVKRYITSRMDEPHCNIVRKIYIHEQPRKLVKIYIASFLPSPENVLWMKFEFGEKQA